MTAIPKTSHWISPEEYLEGERHSQVRHEYIEGAVFAMAGGSRDHNRIARNISVQLTLQFKGGSGETFVNDLKLKTPGRDVYYYPDVMVACDPTDQNDYFCERPSIIFEILSPSTEMTDRREKLLVYKSIPSIDAYVLVEQERMVVTVHRRTSKGWQIEALESPDRILNLPSVQASMTLATIYQGTTAAKR